MCLLAFFTSAVMPCTCRLGASPWTGVGVHCVKYPWLHDREGRNGWQMLSDWAELRPSRPVKPQVARLIVSV